jgi:hypothetical protein
MEAVERLRPYGSEVLVQVKPSFFRGEYTANGQRFRRIAQQRCWKLVRIFDRRRDEDDNLEDDWILDAGNTALPALVKRHLGEAVMRCESTG